MRISLLLIGIVCLCAVGSAHAIPVLSVDLDTSITGIQSSRTVTSGAQFDIDVAITGDGSTRFSISILSTSFNHAGPVLAVSDARAGDLAGSKMSQGAAVDSVASTPEPTSVTAGDALAVAPQSPAFGYGANTGLAGVSIDPPDGGPGTASFDHMADGETVSIVKYTVDALAEGESRISPGNPVIVLADLATGPLPVELKESTVKVVSAAEVPEPMMISLMALGLLLIARRFRKKGA